MKWCPQCRQEYVDSAPGCFECGVPLVSARPGGAAASPGALPAAMMGEPPSDAAAPVAPQLPVRLRVVSELRAEVAAKLQSVGITLAALPGDAAVDVVAPQAVAVAMRLLGADFEGEVDQGPPVEVRIVRRRVKVPPPDREILKLGAKQLAERGAAAIAGLCDLMARGSDREQFEAGRRLVALAQAKAVDAAELVVDAVRGGRVREAKGYLRYFSDQPPKEVGFRLVDDLPRFDPERLALALEVMAQFSDRRVMRSVLPLLDHPDEALRELADDVLICVAGLDMQFDAGADNDERARTIRLWRDWIEENASA